MNRPSIGLIGRVFAILLLTVVIEFGASTLLYERASRFSVREDEARRLAEHLVIARKLVSERSWRERPAMAERMTTDRYMIRWRAAMPRTAGGGTGARHDAAAGGGVGAEPRRCRPAAAADLAGRRGMASGGLRLADGTWLRFRTTEPIHGWDLAIGRIVLALVPAIALVLIAGLLLRRMLRPMERLAHAAERIGLGGSAIVTRPGRWRCAA